MAISPEPPDPGTGNPAPAQQEAVGLLRDLIRIDTSNYGPSPQTVGELAAARYVHDRLTEAGYQPELFTTTGPQRAGVVLRIPGTDTRAGALLLHGHLDVVPADPAGWTHDPFGADVASDPQSGVEMVWGRGAVDMKDMVAMSLAVLRDWGRRGVRPRRDIVALFLPDEEAGGLHGSHWLVDHRRELFAGVTEAIGEVGGFSLTLPTGRRLYLIQTAEKGIAWIRLRATGRMGHGSLVNDENAVTRLAEALARIGNHRFPIRLTDTTSAMVERIGAELGLELDPDDQQSLARSLGPLFRLVRPSLSHTANPTMLTAGEKVNVIPGSAEAALDCRFLPGGEAEFLAGLDELLGPHVSREFLIRDIAVETGFSGPTVTRIAESLAAADPGSLPVPYLLPAGTDAKAFSTLGISCYGFAPLRLPATLDFGALFHGVDERVPIDGLHFGVGVLEEFLRTA